MKIPIKEKFPTYEKLRMSLTRSGVFFPGKVSRLLLEVFVTGEAKISADTLEKRKICGGLRGEFAFWKDTLISKGWLKWSKNYGYEAGIELISFVNSERSAKYTLATTHELEDVKNRMSNLEKVVQSLIEEYDPPYTKEKEENRLKLISREKV